ncbi:MAG: NAD(+) diphosphatase [Bacteroidales bacterium]|nr:NAD(+) diphosphatase [Bacteroidales bacterium]
MKKNWFIFNSKNEILLKDNKIPCAEVSPVECPKENHVFEFSEGCSCFGFDGKAPENYEFEGLRAAHLKLERPVHYKAGKASELVNFDLTYRFCPTCGGRLEYSSEISKKCQNCEKEIWPRINPAIIVLIYRGKDEILLSHARNFRGSFYGLTAGFLETGESLEECIKREISEETSLKVKNIRYFASQPWPYPSQEMMGFFAEYESGEIKIQEEELTDCRWFKRGELPEIPPKISMARMLIDYWDTHREEF